MLNQFRSLRWLLGGIYYGMMVCILGALALFYSHSIEQQYITTLTEKVEGQARLGADMLAPILDSRERAKGVQLNPRKQQSQDESGTEKTLQAILYLIKIRSGVRSSVILLAVDGSVIAEVPPSGGVPRDETQQPEVQEALFDEKNRTGTDIRYVPKQGEEFLFVAVPVIVRKSMKNRIKDEKDLLEAVMTSSTADTSEKSFTYGVLDLAVPTTAVKTAVGHFRTGIALAFVGALVLLLFINVAVSNYVSRPLATLSASAQRFAGGNLDESVEPSGAAEVFSLGESFNQMSEQLRLTITHLAHERAQAVSMLTSMVDGVLVTDLQGTILLLNDSARQICEPREGPILGSKLTEVAPSPELADLLRKTIETALPLRHELTFPQTGERIFEAHLAPVSLDEMLIGVVIVLYDITQQRKLEQDRSDFVANASHELRTPVTSIRAMAETLLDGGIEDAALTNDFLQTIAGESERLTALLDNLLKISHIEADRRLVNPITFDLVELVHHVTGRVMAPITAKRQHLDMDLPEQLPVTADRDALVQILVNLLDNARKYTPDGGTISIHVSGGDDVVRIQVADTGIGIPAADLERIFERFYRVDRARSRAQGGTGLGLAIVKHLVELHGGRIIVESEPAIGSSFTVVLPRQEETAPAEAGELPSETQTTVP
ncbi:MAG: HAMP domain-containing sensor histidine kinase [Armatimonadota bacterium]